MKLLLKYENQNLDKCSLLWMKKIYLGEINIKMKCNDKKSEYNDKIILLHKAIISFLKREFPMRDF